jgi:hypothetical protein
MTQSRLFAILAASTSLTFTACAADEGPNADTASAEGTRIHMMPIQNSSEGAVSNAIAPAISGLTYFGGPVLLHVDVHPVYWNSATKLQPTINAFYPNIVTDSIYTSLLPQYTNAAGTPIGTGTAVAGIVDTRTTASVSDATVQTEISNLINAGRLPKPTANTYYPVHFPSGMTITAPDGSRSCVQFCAYHGTFKRSSDSFNINYGIIPDIGQSGCAGGCGGSTVANNTTSVSSHELVEATTDPAVGLATVFGPPLGWYDQVDNGEIGDLCNGQQAVVGTITVQKEWSNASHACKTTR